MARIIREEEVRRVLRRIAGEEVASTEAGAALAAELRAFVPRKTDLAAVAKRAEDILFGALYSSLGRGMTAILATGEVRRIRMSDLPEMADAVLGVLFDAMDEDAVSYGILHGYAMETGSLSALCALCRRFGSFMTPMELAVLSRIVRDRFPRGEAPDWLEGLG